MKNLKKLSTLLAIISCIVFCCCIFAGCADSGNKYHAEMDSYAGYLMNRDFLKEHKVYSSGNSPESYTFIIDDEEQFKNIFTQYQGKIDFDNKTVVLYIILKNSPRPYELVDLSIDRQNAVIKYKRHDWEDDVKDGIWYPHQRCFMVVLDKVDITSAEFIEV